ncbi:hypothetical protein CASFOL_024900 [Castilleja foliolosa]|uniref:K Homology domain-containing protein n=1 Tax=Castilleja foliolosa TaxID=1961234 RepID=A0ABD3CSU4_9LAMI
MNRRKRRVDIGPIKRPNVTQTWRAVSTQPNSSEGSIPEGLSGPIGPDTFPTKSVSMEIGRPLMHFVKGKEGGTQKEIEAETGVKITFPSSKTENSILIEGNSAESVSNASEKIKTILDKAYNSRELGYSHFVSLPLAIHPGLVDKLVDFQNKILEVAASDKDKNVSDIDAEENQKSTIASKPKDSGIEKSIFIKPKAFHLTVLVLKLWNKDRVKAAAEVLQSVSSKVMDVLENKPVSIRLKGLSKLNQAFFNHGWAFAFKMVVKSNFGHPSFPLDIMKGSLAKAQVVYVPVEEIGDEERLLRACEVIIAAFAEAGLVSENDMKQKLKLHASVMNALHRRRKKRTKKLDLFDARGIFDLYGSEDWGEYLIREAHLSQRFVYDENGYYHCCASIPFPEEMNLD